ncbi:MAG: hypothetical protein TQ37_10300 [Candidatus Synechococcus spongiarum 15L]|uniref:Uncharacterized protein n=2 Tax=Candidatus Synechococcus spongiarum TaxID=431041 RepID=A0A1T1CC43_9SYNE|nr:MAG: hypothetical protein TQ37_10300 [Candidatus Synechococcus spongiarum 15L]OOV26249.1 hypothetical protein BV61_06720 [Candidatus Synechococcus spongiarum LMB bulk15M]
MNHGAVTSSPPITKSEDQDSPARIPWWRQWLEPVVAGAIISALVIALVSVGVAGFQSLKGDIRDVETRLSDEIIATETRLTEKIEAVKMDVTATEARLSKAIAASEARQRQDLQDFKAEVKADNRALNEKLDRILERLPTPEA